MSHTAFGPVLELALRAPVLLPPSFVAVVEGIWVSDAGGYSIGPAASLIAALPTSIHVGLIGAVYWVNHPYAKVRCLLSPLFAAKPAQGG